ncbi:MAG: DUF3570 domain-containing protein [Bacteroidota bacterium]
MIIRYLIVGSLAMAHFIARAQQIANPVDQQINRTTIELVYNHYEQDGDNSAVTGGEGTEKLSVYGPSATINWQKSQHSFSLQIGADIISSASTDNIDSVVSSASIKDARSYGNLSYARQFKESENSFYIGGGFSIESDYFSVAQKAGLLFKSPDLERTYKVELSLYHDDLRWGRLDDDSFLQPQFLIYPEELRTQEWYENFRRTSINLRTAYTQRLGNQNILGIFPELSHQSGLLATPFHRVYFEDGSVGVEQVPDQRLKAALGLRLNSALSDRTIVKHGIEGYTDNFGILGLALSHELSYRLSPDLIVGYSLRFFTQKGARFFRPFEEHELESEFHTSDYDLSTFNTYSGGILLKYSPLFFIGQNTYFDTITLRYRYLERSNRLSAHMISIAFVLQKNRVR